MRALTVAELIAATQGVLLHGSSAAVATSVSTDSRSVGEGALFVPIVGENFDGHDYVNKALAAGASVALTARGTEEFLPGKSYILVDD
ncbi:MAG: UDP-N-acetylmuramoyl-tripeptide--D-alanyl-D-alanine ligase, partial [Oscillospiraceae bacterium]|nr:UDP-N-acetylmuramoyl-tripeptide--D-alanyl-D-alanine ligase [Oscillospiraceae bacterium]